MITLIKLTFSECDKIEPVEPFYLRGSFATNIEHA